MKKPKCTLKTVIKGGIILCYVVLIALLMLQALKPGNESAQISNSVGDKINEVATDIQKPEAETVSMESVRISSVTVSGKKHSGDSVPLFIGETGTVNTSILPSNATNQSLIYTSSDESVLTVYPDGKISAKSAGSVTITVTSRENEALTDTIEVTVSRVFAEKIEIGNVPKEITVGEKHKLEIKFTPKNTSDKSIVWESSAPEVLEISKSGSLTAKAEGSATITATLASNSEIIATVEIMVGPKSEKPVIPVESITLTADNQVKHVGSSVKLSATFFPADAQGKIEWFSSDENVATVSAKGVVSCIEAGEVTITAKCGDNIESKITITVKEILSENIALKFDGLKSDGEKYTVKQGESAKVIATLDKNATVLDIFYASSDEGVAKIGPDGVIEALEGGTTTITVSTSYDGEVTEESFTLEVEAITFKDTFSNFYYVVRKSIGHFGAFLVLGIFASLTYYIICKKTLGGKLLAFGITVFAGFAVAGITEILQLPYFTTGRHCSFDDVLLDFRGHCYSTIPIYVLILAVHFILMLSAKIKARKMV